MNCRYLGKNDGITITVWNHRKVHKKGKAGFLGCVRIMSNAIQRLKDTGCRCLSLHFLCGVVSVGSSLAVVSRPETGPVQGRAGRSGHGEGADRDLSSLEGLRPGIGESERGRGSSRDTQGRPASPWNPVPASLGGEADPFGKIVLYQSSRQVISPRQAKVQSSGSLDVPSCPSSRII